MFNSKKSHKHKKEGLTKAPKTLKRRIGYMASLRCGEDKID